MARRLQPTFADYVVIAITPALIMFLVGSLVFFLIEVFYQGQYNARLQFIMAMFVMGAVCIGRISIEDGREYAMGFALPLAGVTALATWRFVEFRGFLANFSIFVNLGLIGLIWWCADRLTWDCTVIDEREDSSGEGLLQTVGLDDGDEANNESAEDPEATSGQETPAQTLWQKFVEHRRRPHAPGVWVVYFSLAALPIFGIGQWFVQAGDLSSRRWIFKLLVMYVAAALGLLLTTSFLGLRRYLRQRRLEMPEAMAGVWMGVGVAMIIALLIACLAMPRRNPEYSVTHLPIFAGAPKDLKTNKFGFGNDGPEKEDADRTVQRQDGKQQMQGGDQQGGNDKGGSKGGKQSRAGQQSKGRQSKGAQSKGAQSKGAKKGDRSQSGKSDANRPQKDRSQDGPSQGKQSDRSQSGDGQKQSNSGKQGGGRGEGDQQNEDEDSRRSENSDSKGGSNQQEQRDRSQAKQSRAEDQQRPSGKRRPSDGDSNRQPSRSNPSFSPQRMLSSIGWGIGALIKLIYWIVVIGVVAFLVWKYWDQIRQAVSNFIQALREFWARLFGKEREVVEDAEEDLGPTEPPPRPFSDFADPFVSGMADRVSTDELIRYSFEAFEAWARERGCERAPEQTPHEFAQMVSRQERSLGKNALRLAELYAWSAFGKTAVPKSSTEHVRKFWQQITSVAV